MALGTLAIGAVVLTGCAGGPTTTYESLAIANGQTPPPRTAATMVFFPPGKEIVLFAGSAVPSGQELGDTWVFDRHGWRQLHPAVSPPTRAEATMAYDPQLGEIVLYGGCTPCGGPPGAFKLSQDIWAFDGSDWHELMSAQTPTYEPSPLLAWDTANQTLELLAPPPGYGPSPPDGDFDANGGALGLWSWTSSGWAWDGVTSGPPLFIPAASFVDEPGSILMLFYSYQPYSGSCAPGPPFCPGADPTGLTFSQTWTWDGTSFVKAHPTQAPTSSQLVAGDQRIGRVVAIAESKVWTWSGSNWIVQGSAPTMSCTQGTYDPDLGDLIVLGSASTQCSTSATWAWDGNNWLQG